MKEISKTLIDGTIKLNIPLCRDEVIELYTLYSGLEIDEYERWLHTHKYGGGPCGARKSFCSNGYGFELSY